MDIKLIGYCRSPVVPCVRQLDPFLQAAPQLLCAGEVMDGWKDCLVVGRGVEKLTPQERRCQSIGRKHHELP